jgi:tRNA 2-thiouridine synthesizing protein E
MEERTYGGVSVQCNELGYLTDLNQWNREVAKDIAREEGVELTDRHWDVLTYLRDQVKQEIPLTIRKVGKSGIVDIKEFYGLFPDGPLKKASRIAGIPRPLSCI